MKLIRQVHKTVRYRAEKELNSGDAKLEFLSQTDLSYTLIGFVGPILLRPTMFGVSENEDMTGFVHRWRVLGYLHGIEDKYNPFHESTLLSMAMILYKISTNILRRPREIAAENTFSKYKI